MPYDPTLPVNGDIIDADELRGQFAGLKELIDAVPEGPQGAQGIPGPQGPPVGTAVIESVATLNPGEAASVSVSFDSTNVRFSFGIPRGADGAPGAAGEVSVAQMTDAISVALIQTARNPSGITSFAGTFSDPPTQGEMQAFAAYVESLRLDLLRAP